MKQDELNKRLYDAVSDNRISEIEQLLKQGADVNVKDKNGWTPLHWAAFKGNIDIGKCLIENGAIVNATDKDGWTPLHWALGWNQIGVAKFLIENGADVNIKDNAGWTPLHQAVFKGNIDIGKCLIENGADPFIKNKYGQTPLDLCNNDTIREMLEKYMNEYNQIINETKNNEYSIFNNNLLDAVFNSDLIEVKKCVFSGKYNIDVQDDKGYTPLMYAIMDHNFNIVEFLVEHGADINLCNNKGQSPLKIAFRYHSDEIAKYLLKNGALDKNLEDRKEIDSNKNI